jgi:hypothetical protein
MANIFAVTARRYPIVDEEAGAALGLVLFERKPGVAMRRNLLSEWFFIEQGKIRSIYASMFYPEPRPWRPTGRLSTATGRWRRRRNSVTPP